MKVSRRLLGAALLLSITCVAQAASFDCAKARSTTEKLICADPKLSKLDDELSGLYKNAKAAATDQEAFKKQTSDEWKWREANCSDAACLTSWYEKRKAQLLKISGGEPKAATPVAESRPAATAYKADGKTPVTLTGTVVQDEEEFGIKLASPIVVEGDELCGKQTLTTVWLFGKNPQAAAQVGKPFQATGVLDCPRGGYVLRPAGNGNQGVAQPSPSGKLQAPRGVYITEMTDEYMTMWVEFFADNGAYVRITMMKLPNSKRKDASIFEVIAGTCKSGGDTLLCTIRGSSNVATALQKGKADVTMDEFMPEKDLIETTDQLQYNENGGFRRKRIKVTTKGQIQPAKGSDWETVWARRSSDPAKDENGWKVVRALVPAKYLQ